MLRLVVLLLLAAGLSAQELPKGKYHINLLKDAPAIFDAGGKPVVPRHITSQKYLILYFSASWCPPCHRFNPEFIAWYQKNGGRKDVEVILVGSDEDTAAIKAYMRDQKFPWLAFEKKGPRFEAIQRRYGGNGIPCVAVLDENDEVVAHSYVDGKYRGPMAPLEKYLELAAGK